MVAFCSYCLADFGMLLCWLSRWCAGGLYNWWTFLCTRVNGRFASGGLYVSQARAQSSELS